MAVLNSVIQCCQTKRRIPFGDSNDHHKIRRRGLACVGASLSESAAIYQAMVLIAVPGGLLDSQQIERDPEEKARRVTGAGLPLSNLLYLFGDGFDGQPPNSNSKSVRTADLPEIFHWQVGGEES